MAIFRRVIALPIIAMLRNGKMETGYAVTPVPLHLKRESAPVGPDITMGAYSARVNHLPRRDLLGD